MCSAWKSEDIRQVTEMHQILHMKNIAAFWIDLKPVTDTGALRMPINGLTNKDTQTKIYCNELSQFTQATHVWIVGDNPCNAWDKMLNLHREAPAAWIRFETSTFLLWVNTANHWASWSDVTPSSLTFNLKTDTFCIFKSLSVTSDKPRWT